MMATLIGELKLSIFGSVLTRHDPADLDLLVIYEDLDRAKSLRSVVDALNHWCEPEIDLICMRPAEQLFYEFLRDAPSLRLI